MISYFLISVFVIITSLIIISALRNPIPRKIGFRNVFRRLGNTSLVILGSMVGTALITGSLIMQDSMDETTAKIVEQNVGEKDLLLSITEKSLSQDRFSYLNNSEVTTISDALASDKIDGILSVYEFNVAPSKLDNNGHAITQTFLSSMIALDPFELETFGENPVDLDLKDYENNEALVSESLASALDLEEGGTVKVEIAGETFEYKVKEIAKEDGVLVLKSFIVKKDSIENRFKLEKDSGTSMWISAKGGITPEGIDSKEYIGNEFQNLVDSKLQGINFANVEIEATEIKESELTGDGMDELGKAFLFLSTFGAMAGVLLIINLYSMLAEERKMEMGIMRAIAFTRGQLIRTFLYEGFIYSVLSSIVGVVFGLGVGYFFTKVFASIMNDISDFMGLGGALNYEFAFTLNSLLIGGVAGFVITIITVFAASYTTSKINIVNAIRKLTEKKRIKLNLWKKIRLGFNFLIVIFSGLAVVISRLLPSYLEDEREGGTGFLADQTQRDFDELRDLLSAYPLFIGTIVFIWVLSFVVNTLLKIIKGKDYSRYVFSFAAIASILFNTFIDKFEYISEAIGYQAGAPIFFLNGLILVIASAVLISFNIDIIVHFLSFIFRRFGKINSIFKIALRYPGEDPKRTGLTMIMFAIIIYLIIFISSFKFSIKNEIETVQKEFMGDYSIRVAVEEFTSDDEARKISEKVENLDDVEEVLSLQDITLSFPEYIREEPSDGNEPLSEVDQLLKSYAILGPNKFLDSLSGVEFKEMLPEYEDASDVWQAINEDSSKIVLGYWFRSEDFKKGYLNEDGDQASDIKAGDTIIIGDYFGEQKSEKTVIALVSDESDNPYVEGILVGENFDQDNFQDIYSEKFGSQSLLIKEKEGESISEVKKSVEKELIGEKVSMILDLGDLIGTVVNMLNSMFLIFQGFLGLSLIIGSSGLAIIIARAVNERRQQIGMLRSLGFQRNMILIAFFIESTFIAFLSIAIGVSMGIISVENSFEILMSGSGIEIAYPVSEIIYIILGVYFLSLLFSLWPSLRASKLEPVEATNYPE